MKNVNDVDFDTNMNYNMCMKVMLLFIDIKPRVAYKSIYIMCIVIYIIYVHDDVDVSVNGYVNVLVD